MYIMLYSYWPSHQIWRTISTWITLGLAYKYANSNVTDCCSDADDKFTSPNSWCWSALIKSDKPCHKIVVAELSCEKLWYIASVYYSKLIFVPWKCLLCVRVLEIGLTVSKKHWGRNTGVFRIKRCAKIIFTSSLDYGAVNYITNSSWNFPHCVKIQENSKH